MSHLDHIRSYYEALNTGDVELIASHFTDDAVHYYTVPFVASIVELTGISEVLRQPLRRLPLGRYDRSERVGDQDLRRLISLPVRFSLRFFLPFGRTLSFTLPAAVTALLSARARREVPAGRCFTTPLPLRANLPGPGTRTMSVAVPTLVFRARHGDRPSRWDAEGLRAASRWGCEAAIQARGPQIGVDFGVDPT